MAVKYLSKLAKNNKNLIFKNCKKLHFYQHFIFKKTKI